MQRFMTRKSIAHKKRQMPKHFIQSALAQRVLGDTLKERYIRLLAR
jgi:hypothetical protein